MLRGLRQRSWGKRLKTRSTIQSSSMPLTMQHAAIWAATSGGNDKYQSKLADMVDLEYVANVGGITMYSYNESTSSDSATAATQTTSINPVPEPAGMVGVGGAAVCGATVLVCRRRRRVAA